MTDGAFNELAGSVPALAPPQSEDYRRLVAAVDLMRTRPAETHTVSRLAKVVGMSRSNFAEAFRVSLGRSPMEFLRALRLDHAADLLRTSDLPIKLVGARAGYGSRTSFAHAFRRAFGLSPMDFRAARTENRPTDIHAVSARLRTQRGAAQDLSWEVDLATGAVWWSEGTFAALGYDTRRRLVSDVAHFYQRIHPDSVS
jgi:AraC-like DNA-binding protein